MASSGGLKSARLFRGRDAILSGPAGGVVGMAETAQARRLRQGHRLRHGRHVDRRRALRRRVRALVRDAGRRRAHARADAARPYGGGGRRLDPRPTTARASASARQRRRRPRPQVPTAAAARSPSPTPTSWSASSTRGSSRRSSGPAHDQPLDDEAVRAAFAELAARDRRRPHAGGDRRRLHPHRRREHGQRHQEDLRRARLRRDRVRAQLLRLGRRPARLPDRRHARHRDGAGPSAVGAAVGVRHGPGAAPRQPRAVDRGAARRRDHARAGKPRLRRSAARRPRSCSTRASSTTPSPSRASCICATTAPTRRCPCRCRSRASCAATSRRCTASASASSRRRRTSSPPRIEVAAAGGERLSLSPTGETVVCAAVGVAGVRHAKPRAAAETDALLFARGVARRAGRAARGPRARRSASPARRSSSSRTRPSSSSRAGAWRLTAAQRPRPDAHHAARSASASAPTADPVLLEVFNNLFMAIAEQMGEALRNTAQSVNIKERLDFSCAVFDATGAARRQRAAHAGAPRLHGPLGRDRHPRARRRAAAGRRLHAQRALQRRHAPARHHRHHAGVRRRPAARCCSTWRAAAITRTSAA